MSILKKSRQYHKWLMLFLGVQFVIWSVTGAYMVFFNIDYIHGDTLVKNHQTKMSTQNIKLSLTKLVARYPEAKNIEMGIFIDQEVYRFTDNELKVLVSATTGKQLSPLTESEAIIAAKHLYTGSGSVESVELIKDNPPFELSRRVHSALPAWRVNFDDLGSPALYISATNGKLLAKRHNFWRIFDWMFNFHAMDYIDGAIDNWLLFWTTLFGIFASITGLILMYFRVFKANVDARGELVVSVSKSGGAV
jgi:Cu(I)/Ag(I) efflux system membrane protein CusA/SilA